MAMDEPLFMVIVPLVGARVVDPLTVNAPATENVAVGCVIGVPAIVNPANVSVPELLTDQPVPVMVIVPPVGASIVDPLTVNAPATEMLAAGCVAGVPAMVRPLNISVAALLTDQPVPLIVIVPAEGERFALAFTVSAAAILKLADVVTVADAAMVNP